MARRERCRGMRQTKRERAGVRAPESLEGTAVKASELLQADSDRIQPDIEIPESQRRRRGVKLKGTEQQKRRAECKSVLFVCR